MRTKRILLFVLLAVFACTTIGSGAPAKKKKPPCAADIEHCPPQGCGGDFDANLNELKNTLPNDESAAGPAESHSLTWMKKLADPENFEKSGPRDELSDLGEGKKISVVAYLLVAKPELGGESCNCGLHTARETDNHLVLVSKATVDKFPLDSDADKDTAKETFHSRELESITAEFTPRVRKTHPNFTREKIQPMIDDTDQGALLVRVTGLLLFDSEHFLGNHLVRVNNWEIHPVLKMEVCTTGNCTSKSDAGWKSLDEM